MGQPVGQHQTGPWVLPHDRPWVRERRAGGSRGFAEIADAEVLVRLPVDVRLRRAVPRPTQPLEQRFVVKPQSATLPVIRIVLRRLPPVVCCRDAQSEVPQCSGDGGCAAAVHAHHEQPWSDWHGGLDGRGRMGGHGSCVTASADPLSAGGRRRA